MARRVSVPIKVVNGEDWAELSALAPSHTHQICGETFKQLQDMSFAGGHRVRLFAFKKSVHWRLPAGIELNIADVPLPVTPPRRRR
jgi:hypothetical protein